MAELQRFEFQVPEPSIHPSPRWVRVRVGDTWIADSRRSLLLVRYGREVLPTYCVPADDVRTDLLHASGPPEAGVIPHDVRVGDEALPGAAILFAGPPAPLAELDGYWSFTWDDARLAWFEEATQAYVHARDPFKRVDALASERHVRVEIDGQLVAESRRPHALFETSLPTRWYLPFIDVRQELLEPSDTVSQCPYKGTANYYSVRIGDTVHRDVAWTYPNTIPECTKIVGLVAFFNERVDLVIDGVREERPLTPWSV